MDELRFGFGRNWQKFLSESDGKNLSQAKESIDRRLRGSYLEGKRFLDAGCGSGVFSLAAMEYGAEVVSFDYDKNSVDCALSLRQKGGADHWRIFTGSLLDNAFMTSLGKFDVVYCWGVAHHTGDMWHALDNVAKASEGDIVLSIYNDQGKPSRRWLLVKRLYNQHPMLRPALVALTWLRLWAVKFAADSLRGAPLRRWRSNNEDSRGMSAKRDLIDWVGGYPFEVAKPEEIFHFFKERDFELLDMSTQAGGIGCNEFHFRKNVNGASL